jgi:hypothetical protein
MEYTLINTDLTCGGIVGTEPTHNNWTLTPYLGGLVKEKWNGNAWIESATIEEIQEVQNKIKELLNKQQYDELFPTDWYIVRYVETGIAIPKSILDVRQAIRNKY